MMKTALLAAALLLNITLLAQKNIPATDTLFVTGKVKGNALFTLNDLAGMATAPVPQQVIYNHSGEAKDTLTNMRGVPLKTVLESVMYDYEKPRALNEFYFVFTASDGYRVVFSWNEIYNTECGNDLFIVTEMKGKQLKEMDQRIVFIAAGDLKTGRRYIKGLRTIEVKQLEK